MWQMVNPKIANRLCALENQDYTSLTDCWPNERIIEMRPEKDTNILFLYHQGLTRIMFPSEETRNDVFLNMTHKEAMLLIYKAQNQWHTK